MEDLEELRRLENEQLALNLKCTIDIVMQKCERCESEMGCLGCTFSTGEMRDILYQQYKYLYLLDESAVEKVFADELDKYVDFLKK